jgi:DNA-binding transcriptional LysR family regulator
MERLETRELAYFLAVADELHFSRAAARLGIAQPALSKAIIQLERRLDVRLFERNSRAVALTPAGEVLASEARYALDAITAASRRTRRAAGQEPGLILAMKAGMDAGLLPMILAAYEREPDSLPVQVMFGTDYARLLRDGHADVHCSTTSTTCADSTPNRCVPNLGWPCSPSAIAWRTVPT